RVVLYFDVLEELLFHARYRSEDTAAILIGTLKPEDGEEGCVEIRGFASASWIETRRDWLQMLHKRLPGVVDTMRSEEQTVVGWSIARRGCASLLDAEDLLIHLTFFNLPHHGLLVLDLDADTLAFYQRTEEGALINVGFELVSLQDTRSKQEEEEDVLLVEVADVEEVVDDEGAQPLAHGPEPEEAPLLVGAGEAKSKPDRAQPEDSVQVADNPFSEDKVDVGLDGWELTDDVDAYLMYLDDAHDALTPRDEPEQVTEPEGDEEP
ncbi:MAG: hypothetical protein AAFS10_03745, partial [Myxococcota bacterium]